MEYLNLSKILKKHEGELFYTSILGRVELVHVYADSIVVQGKGDKVCMTLDCCGRVSEHGEPVLFPSTLCRNWNTWIQTQCKTWKAVQIEHGHQKSIKTIMEFSKQYDDTILQSAAAYMKIMKVIEYGYGGIITNKEWMETSAKIGIHVTQDENEISIKTCFNTVFPIAFRTKELADEFLSYPENVELVKTYYNV